MSNFLRKEHHDIRDRVRRFAEAEIKPVISKYDEGEKFPVNLVKRMGDIGLLGMYLPENFGGKNTDYLSYIIAVEELARVDSSMAATLAAHNSLGIGPVYEFGTAQQKEKYLPGLTTGEALWAFGLTEKNAGSDARGVKTRAVSDGDEYVVNGSKIFITNGSSEITAGATLEAITGEKDGKKELSAILVESNIPGYSTKPMHGKMMWRAADNGLMYFDNCRVPKSNLLGEEGQGAKIMLKTLDSGRLSIAGLGLGLAQGAYEMAISYAKKRKQFGKYISEFQVVANKLADMALKIELARNTLYKACWLKDTGQSFTTEAAMAKLYCSEIAREVADESVQIHGGYGLLKSNHIERFYRDQRILQIGEGTSEILRLVISRNILKDK
jgi:alkylation response protein AidB-like acyl-CoA dehydrogenase